MLKSISKTLLTGFITVVPVVLTIYLLYWLAITSENMMVIALHWFVSDEIYFPGMGMIAGLVVVFVAGLLMKAIFVRQIFSFGEKILYRVPLIKTVYRSIRDLFEFFSPKKEGFGKVVSVNINGMLMIGFVTQDDTSSLPAFAQQRDSVLVYLPMSYMIGGFTLLIPKKDIHPCDMGMDEAMRFVLTAGITGKSD
ncbi:MAG: hypothetical protein DIZ80_05770 [endosymbiont of Galathealinum brachiosum]|uniref:DUF502 domain-containing protein n=1 Tax=endosymbiont of Galathealinum brachiosum TaxID=2200906 RepID=A0A370DJC1_9GAMM|nr:MAG: hypothetical protein DIZ80_05770 [endosymbiont of Galathealinum brachiosum]